MPFGIVCSVRTVLSILSYVGRGEKMKRYIITTGTITYAMKGRDILRRKGFNASIERITSGLGSAGCGYTIVISGDISSAEKILRGAGIKILGINEKN